MYKFNIIIRKAVFKGDESDMPKELQKMLKYALMENKKEDQKTKVMEEVLKDYIKLEVSRKFSMAVYTQTRGKGISIHKYK